MDMDCNISSESGIQCPICSRFMRIDIDGIMGKVESIDGDTSLSIHLSVKTVFLKCTNCGKGEHVNVNDQGRI